ncbi:unnamed protein product [Heterobilharzia americana]|nr:unnamed protein product [Heterobilharzia americana]
MSRVLRSSIRENKSQNVTSNLQLDKRVFSASHSVSSRCPSTSTRRLTQAKGSHSSNNLKEIPAFVSSESSDAQDKVHASDEPNASLDTCQEMSTSAGYGFSAAQSSVDILNKSDSPPSEKNDGLIVGRKDKIEYITSLIQSYIDTRKSASIYISGAPGTGKTAVVLNVVHDFNKVGRCDTVIINCMRLTSCADIFAQIAIDLRAYRNKENHPITDAVSLESCLNDYSERRTIILVLDEVDQLSSRGQELLYRIFEWPSKLTCHIIVVGVSNALDLPERLLPRLKSNVHKPVHIVFQPYSQSELVDIVQAHLSKSVNGGSFIEPLAVQLCSRKIAASTGDARTALDVCRRAIDLAQQEARSKNISDKFTPLHTMDITPRLPSIKHISRALKESQVDSSYEGILSQGKKTTTNGCELPLHHKLLLASCLLLRQQKGLRELPFSILYETYLIVCKTKQITNLSESELSAVCDLLDSRGFIQFTGPRYSVKSTLGTPARLRRIRLRLDDRGVHHALMDDLLLSSIMDMKLGK